MSLQHQDKSREHRSGKSTIEFAEIKGAGLKVSRVGLGTWAIGGWMWGGTDEANSIKTIRAALALGLNVIDTAPVYGFGRSEEIVGKALAEGLRERTVVATKVGLEWHDGKITRNSSRDRIMREVEDSLRRLKSDTIDIYQVHWPDPKVPVTETANAMRELFEQGTIRAIGVSNRGANGCVPQDRATPRSSTALQSVRARYRARRAPLLQEARHRHLRLRRAVPRAALRTHADRHQVQGR
jgi:aryl-alcohol dehydrogenase-like predicted oxidoreductase